MSCSRARLRSVPTTLDDESNQVSASLALDLNASTLSFAKHPDAVLQRRHAGVPQSQGGGIYAPKLLSHCGDGSAMTVRLPGRARLGNGVATEAKRHVERASPKDVGADAQPIWDQVRVSDPCLQVGRSGRERRPRRNRPRCREEQETATVYLNLRSEEIVACREEKRGGEGDVNLHLF